MKLDLTRYRWTWREFVFCYLGLLSVVVFVVTSFVFGGHAIGVDHSTKDQRKIINENKMWEMLRGTRPLDDSAPGHLARVLKPAFDSKDEVGALLHVYIRPTEFQDDNQIIYSTVTPLESDGGGHLTASFILKAVRAKSNLHAVLRTVPPAKKTGYYTLQNAIRFFVATPLLIFLIFLSSWIVNPLRAASTRRKTEREHRRWLADLTPQARRIYDVQQVLAKMDGSDQEVLDARVKASKAFKLATSGWLKAEQRQQLRELVKDLSLDAEAMSYGQSRLEDNDVT